MRRDGLDGNFKFPACLTTHHWTFPASRPSDVVWARVWDWLGENGITRPRHILWTRYVKYLAGDYVIVTHYVNPDAVGFQSAADGRSEWSASAIQSDSARAAYVDRFNAWGLQMGVNARASLTDGKPRQAPLADLPAR